MGEEFLSLKVIQSLPIHGDYIQKVKKWKFLALSLQGALEISLFLVVLLEGLRGEIFP